MVDDIGLQLVLINETMGTYFKRCASHSPLLKCAKVEEDNCSGTRIS